MAEERQPEFRRNPATEELLNKLNALLAPAEVALQESRTERPRPFVLVLGPPRSGTTLLLQWLAYSGAFAYPTNFLSRFWMAPAVGAMIERLLFDEQFAVRDEFFDLKPSAGAFTSDLGKTRGALAPNEFWYFWRRFLPGAEIAHIGPRLLESDLKGLRREIAAIADVFNKPLAMKGLMVQYDLAAFAQAVPEARFVHVKRDTLGNAASLLRARERFFGSRETWYSAKPPEYAQLRHRSPMDQVVCQVVFSNHWISRGLRGVSADRWLSVDYEQFCLQPATLWGPIMTMLGGIGEQAHIAYSGPSSFVASDTTFGLTPEDLASLREAVERAEPEPMDPGAEDE